MEKKQRKKEEFYSSWKSEIRNACYLDHGNMREDRIMGIVELLLAAKDEEIKENVIGVVDVEGFHYPTELVKERLSDVKPLNMPF